MYVVLTRTQVFRFQVGEFACELIGGSARRLGRAQPAVLYSPFGLVDEGLVGQDGQGGLLDIGVFALSWVTLDALLEEINCGMEAFELVGLTAGRAHFASLAL